MNHVGNLNVVCFLIDSTVIPYVVLSHDEADHSVPKVIEELGKERFDLLVKTGQYLPDLDYNDPILAGEILETSCNIVNSFSGSITPVMSESVAITGTQELEDQRIMFIPAQHQPKLFKPAYASPEALRAEFENVLLDNHVKLPEDFDWEKHVVLLRGNYDLWDNPLVTLDFFVRRDKDDKKPIDCTRA